MSMAFSTNPAQVVSLVVSVATLVSLVGAAALFFIRFGRNQQAAVSKDEVHDKEVDRLNGEMKELSSIVKDLLLVQTRQAITVDNHTGQLKDIEARLRKLERSP